MEQHYDLVVIGSGSGNTIVDDSWADKRVAIIDHGRFGGTCLNVGCIPTKMFVHPADLVREAAHLPALGVAASTGDADWRAIRDRVFARIDPISDGGLAWRKQSQNVDVYEETARFVGERRLQVGRDVLTADQVVIATGSRPRELDLPGADEAETRLHTSDSIMRLAKLPRRLVILGGGYIAAEFAHVFATFGSKVTIVARGERLLGREDREVSEVFTSQLAEHVDVRLRQSPTGFVTRPTGVTVFCTDPDGAEYEYDADVVLLAMGRVPNADTLDCAAGGVDVDADGFVTVDEHLRTSVPGVFALGDVCTPDMLKHVANHQARVVAHNLTHPEDLERWRSEAIPHAVFSLPQLASVGLTEQDARQAHEDVVTGTRDYSDVAYGWAMEIERGRALCKVVATSDGEILGAHVVGPHAAMLVQPFVQAMALKTSLRDFATQQYWIHPAMTEVLENAALAALEAGQAA